MHDVSWTNRINVINLFALLVYSLSCMFCLVTLYITSEPEVYKTEFGDGMQPQVMYYPTCSGSENSLVDCDYKSYGSFVLSRPNTAGILCFDGKL